MSCSETERRYCHCHLSSSHLAAGLQIKNLKSIILKKSLFVKRGTKITQLVPIICVCNSNEVTDIQSPLRKVHSAPLPKNSTRPEVLGEAIMENIVPCPEDESCEFVSCVSIFL
jgi:hypothetical protein